MKKSVFTLLAIATAVFTMSSCSQNDGGSSNDLNLQQSSSDSSPVVNGNEGSVNTVVSTDCFDFFDITIVRTAGNDTKTLTLNQSSTMGAANVKMVDDKFTISSNDAFSVKATVSLKANWKEVAAAKGDAKVYLGGNTGYKIPGHSNWGQLNCASFKASELTEDMMQEMAKSLVGKIEASK